MIRPLTPCLFFLAALVSACSPTTPTAPAAAPAPDPGTARKAVDLTLASLSKRSFDVQGCAPAEARVVPETEALTAPAQSEACTMLVAQRSDQTWLVVVRSAPSSKSYGARALVTVAAKAEGIAAIEYAR